MFVCVVLLTYDGNHPDHEVGENGDPEDGVDECEHEEFLPAAPWPPAVRDRQHEDQGHGKHHHPEHTLTPRVGEGQGRLKLIRVLCKHTRVKLKGHFKGHTC